MHPRVHYLITPSVRGFFEWVPMSTVAYQAHIAVIEGDAEAFSRAACRWMFNQGAKKLVVMAPAYNWHAKALARKIGFVCEGTLTCAVEWRGRLHDMAVLGMSDA
jgi:hypothetical protein